MSTIDGEEWREIEFEGYPYAASNMGRIRLKTGGITLGSTRDGYRICNTHHLVHRIVALAFIPNPDKKPFVNHIDGNRGNNRISNLEWVTPRENVRHAIATGLKGAGKHGRSVRQLDLAGGLIAEHRSITDASRATGCNSGNIGSACRGERYKTVGGFRWEYGEQLGLGGDLVESPIQVPVPITSPAQPPLIAGDLGQAGVSEAPDVDPVDQLISDFYSVPFRAPRAKAQIPSECGRPVQTNRGRPVRQLSLDGELVAEYASVAEAVRKTRIGSGNISGACRGVSGRKTLGGYRWEYGKFPWEQDAELAAAPVVTAAAPPAPAAAPVSDDDPLWEELGI
jgi:hypothetical protein